MRPFYQVIDVFDGSKNNRAVTSLSALSGCPKLDYRNRVGLQVYREFPGIIQRPADRGDRIGTIERRGIRKPGAYRVYGYFVDHIDSRAVCSDLCRSDLILLQLRRPVKGTDRDSFSTASSSERSAHNGRLSTLQRSATVSEDLPQLLATLDIIQKPTPPE